MKSLDHCALVLPDKPSGSAALLVIPTELGAHFRYYRFDAVCIWNSVARSAGGRR
jgi:hypothetical protein